MTNLRLSRAQAEKAFSAFIQGHITNAPESVQDVPVNVRMGSFSGQTGQFELSNLAEIPLPVIVVSCPRSERHPMGFASCELHLLVLSSIDEDDVVTKHMDRVGWLSQLVSEQTMETVLAALNPPAEGPDLRTVTDFMAFGYLPQDDISQEADRCFVDDFVFTLHCQPTSDTSL